MNTQEIKTLAQDTIDDWKRDQPNADIDTIISDEHGAWTGSNEDWFEFEYYLNRYFN